MLQPKLLQAQTMQLKYQQMEKTQIKITSFLMMIGMELHIIQMVILKYKMRIK